MKINIDLLLLCSEENDLPELVKGFTAEDGKKYKKGIPLSKDNLVEIKNSGAVTLDVQYDQVFFGRLNKLDPVNYRLPVKAITCADLTKEVQFIKFANKNSKKKRKLLSCCELYDEKGRVVVKFGEEITALVLKKIESIFGNTLYVPVNYDEHKIILLVNLRPVGGDFVKRFQLNADITYNLIKENRANPLANQLANLVVEKDVLIVDDPTELLTVYRDSKVRLILIGDALSSEYKNALVSVKKHDPYARLMLANKTDPNDIMRFLFDVEFLYNKDNWL